MMKFPVSEAHCDEVMPEIDRLSLERRSIIWENWPSFVEIAGSWECLRRLHEIMFDGLFDFAGKIRTRNISKGGFRFANSLFLNEILPIISRMPQSNFAEILEKYIEMNIAHPFREGSGRVMRLWLDAMLERETLTRIDWTRITRTDYMSAMQRSPVNSLELATLLRGSMLKPDELRDKDTFLAGLSASYSYEM